MLAVQPVSYLLSNVNLVDYLVCVFLHRSCEDYDFVVFGHRFDELDAAWPHKEVTFLAVL